MPIERLGIFEELQKRSEKYRNKARPRPRYWDTAEARGSIVAIPGIRLKYSVPFWKRTTGMPAGMHQQRRVIYPEALLGLQLTQVVRAVVNESGIALGDLLGRTQKWEVTKPRHVAMWAVDRYCPDYSLPELGYIFHRDHTTILHGIDATNRRLKQHHRETTALVANVRQYLNHLAQAA